ncbi:MAG: glycogen synthase [Patescibacteria group bacterium]
MAKKLNITIIASECTPFVKVGGVADVIGSLPQALSLHDANIRVILPRYKTVDVSTFEKSDQPFVVSTGDGDTECTVYTKTVENIKYIFIDNEKYISNGGVYDALEDDTKTIDDVKRFCFFNMAVCSFMGTTKTPDIIHAHDWHASLVPFLCASDTPTILTIHNILYQGRWEQEPIAAFLKRDDLPAFAGKCNMLRTGIEHAKAITTVSPTYAQEITTPEFGQGLDDVLNHYKDKLSGIINGIDTATFDPETDNHIETQFSTNNREKKIENKIALQEELGLPKNPSAPLIGVVSRLTPQKGLDLLPLILPKLDSLDSQVVVLGTGDKDIETALQNSAGDSQKVLIEFNIETAQKIYAASDMFIIPSRFEPCGLTQMIAMRYGAVPIVRDTGGLHDTVQNYTEKNDSINGNGFVFKKAAATELLHSIKRALAVYHDQPRHWDTLRANAMKTDFSWDVSALAYLSLYKKLLR